MNLLITPIKLQVEVLAILVIVVLIFILLIIMNRAIKRADVYAKPKGWVLIGLIYYKFMLGLTTDNMGKKAGKIYAPYIAAIALFMVISNLSGLFGLAQPTANLSVTLSLALITWVLLQSTKIRVNGIKAYLHGFIEPIFPFIIPNFFGTIAPLISMSMRLFGNITSGGTIMMLFYAFTGWVSSFAPVIGGFNFVGVIIAPALHFYFDVFAGFIQTYIFIMLTTIFIGNELPKES
jgi:F-type H+-transporting ATPase subunit a